MCNIGKDSCFGAKVESKQEKNRAVRALTTSQAKDEVAITKDQAKGKILNSKDSEFDSALDFAKDYGTLIGTVSRAGELMCGDEQVESRLIELIKLKMGSLKTAKR